MRPLRILTGWLAATAIVFGGAAVAQEGGGQPTRPAADPQATRLANDVSYQILSPFCPGKSLAMCPSPAAAEVRRDIMEMAKSGMDKDAIKGAVIEEYGEEFRLVEPPWADNVGLLGALAGGLGLAFLAVVIISRRRATPAGDQGAEPTPPPAVGLAETGDQVDDEGDPDESYLSKLREQYRD